MTSATITSDRTGSPSANLRTAGLLPPLPKAFAEGADLDLLLPLRYLGGESPPEIERDATDRSALAEALRTANAGYGHPRAEELSAAFDDPATQVVVTGQQPGLFGGPLFTLTKALGAVLWAERLTAAGRPAIAMFWMATEDHDFRESSRATFFTPRGPRTFDLGEDPQPLVPVGMRSLGPDVSRVLGELAEELPGDLYAEWLEVLGRWYRPEARFGEAFARLLVHLLGERSPIVVDAMLPALKSAQRPWLARLVEERAAVGELTTAREREISARGYELQVRPQPEASPLFMFHDGQRRRIEWLGSDRVTLRGLDVDEPVSWLLEAIEENPGIVSPGALARPAIQDAVLGSMLHVLGPGELSYFPQAAPLYGILGIPAPAVVPRPQALILEAHLAKKLDASGLTLQELIDPSLALDERLAGDDDTRMLDAAEGKVAALLEELREGAVAIDAGLEGPWNKTRSQMLKAVEAFRGKVRAASSRRDEVARRRAELLLEVCRPQGGLQERVISAAHYPGKYGPRLVEAMSEQISLDPANLNSVTP